MNEPKVLMSTCPYCGQKVGTSHKDHCREGKMQKAAEGRPTNYESLDVVAQWYIDRQLGCLDWDGY